MTVILRCQSRSNRPSRGFPQATVAKSFRCVANGAIVTNMSSAPRFLTLADVAEVLNTSLAQVTALVRRQELKALKLGGRGQWRVEAAELEEFITRMYEQTDRHLAQQRGPSPEESTSETPPADVEI